MNKTSALATAWSFFENLNDGIVIVDKSGTVLYGNPTAIAYLGFEDADTALAELADWLAANEAWYERLSSGAKSLMLDVGSMPLSATAVPCDLAGQPVTQIILTPSSLYETAESSTSIEQLAALTRISNEGDFTEKLHLLLESLRQTGWNRVGITLRDEHFNITQIINAGFTPEEETFIAENSMPAEAWLDLLTNEKYLQYRHGTCYFVPGDSEWSDRYLEHILPDNTADSTATGIYWHPRDIFCVPLYDRTHQRIGLLALDQPRNGRRPDTITFQTIELYAQFAASIIENAQLVQDAMERNRESEILLEASNSFSSTLDTDTILGLLGQHMVTAVNADGYIIYQWTSLDNTLTVLKSSTASASKDYAQPDDTVTLEQSSGITEKVLRQQQLTLFHATPKRPAPLPLPPWVNGVQTHTHIFLPLLLSGETFGLVHLISLGERPPYTERETRLLTTLANQGGTALETSLIFEDTYERERFYGALGNVSMALNSKLDKETVLNLICNESLRIFAVDGAYIWQIEGKHFIGSAAKGLGEEEFLRTAVSLEDQNTIVNYIAQSRQAAFFNNVHQSTQFAIRLPQAKNIQSVLAVPLEQEGTLLGILVLVDQHHPDRFSEQDVTRATTFGVQVAIALQNAKLFDELRRLNEELDLRVAKRTRALNEESNRVKVLLRITSELSASLDQDRVLNQALHLVNEVVNATDGVILLVDHETDEFIFRAAINQEIPLSPKGVPSGMKRNEGLAGWMLENRSAVIVNDTQEDPRWVARETSSEYRSVLGVPLISNDEVIGALMMFHNKTSAFTMQQLDLVEAAAIQVANAINNASLYELIFDQAEQLGSMLRSEIIQKANLQAIVESIADGVIVASSNNIIEMANLPACSILDIPREQLLGKSMNHLLGLYGHFGETWIATIKEWSKNSDRLKQWITLRDQLAIEDKFVSVNLSPVLSEGHFFGTVSIFRDITKEVEVDRLKSEFVSTVSHELRTPMTSIKGYADLMLMGASGPLAEPQLRYLQVIKNNADRLHMLVNDLLNISRIETGKTELDLRPLDLTQIVDITVDHLEGRIQHENKHLTVTTDIAPSLPLVNADHTRVTQILTNLLDNAFNYTDIDGVITIAVKPQKEYVYISVSDTGIGIAREDQDKIFDRFFRADDEAVQKVPGTGLGLAIVRSLIEMHGGQLMLESEYGKGSTFTFNLPVVIGDSDPT